jgi:hypothetical protein
VAVKIPGIPRMPALPAFLRTRNGVIAVIVIPALVIAALFALTWTYTPDVYSAVGLRHDASLEKYVTALHSLVIQQHQTNLTTWSVTWLNSTSVKVSWAFTYLGPGNETSNRSQLVTYQEGFVMTNFFGTKAASAYIGRINNGTYRLTNASYGSGGAYDRAFGHPPTTFAEYRQDQGPVGNFIWQFDQFVQVGSLARTYAA